MWRFIAFGVGNDDFFDSSFPVSQRYFETLQAYVGSGNLAAVFVNQILDYCFVLIGEIESAAANYKKNNQDNVFFHDTFLCVS